MKRFNARAAQFALAASSAVLFTVGCASTPDEAPTEVDTGSEFDQGPVVEDTSGTNVSGDVVLDLATVYFDFDQYGVRGDARPILTSNAELMMSARQVVTIEGHTDPRGSEEYNLALGERRANAVRKYLQNLGVPSDSMRVLSYGEAKRAADGNDESAWRWDRRAEFRSGR